MVGKLTALLDPGWICGPLHGEEERRGDRKEKGEQGEKGRRRENLRRPPHWLCPQPLNRGYPTILNHLVTLHIAQRNVSQVLLRNTEQNFKALSAVYRLHTLCTTPCTLYTLYLQL